jgi:hypothetical protein
MTSWNLRMTRLAHWVAALEHAGAAVDFSYLLLIMRADRPDDELVALGDFRCLPGESVDALKARIERRHRSGLLMLRSGYAEQG